MAYTQTILGTRRPQSHVVGDAELGFICLMTATGVIR